MGYGIVIILGAFLAAAGVVEKASAKVGDKLSSGYTVVVEKASGT